ncbi:unnamed protein product [Menidia menidia]|uniref:Sex hormone-binding globulin n=1 Tax=Menidia menidia TaxID=238744 RepID=A0A8S4BCW6_9TELE|nr:unnamed protein product [Menidia menidia]
MTAFFWTTVAGGLLFAVSLAQLGLLAEGQRKLRGRKIVSGGSTIFLGQDRDIWSPLIYTEVNLTRISNIKSSFHLRTYDPEGVIFYGDTKDGEDWFVLSLKDGVPLMQITRENVSVSVAGGPKLNDGGWHTLEVSNEGNFVILEVDRSPALVVGTPYTEEEEDLSSPLRLALGGILIGTEKLIVKFNPKMDGCVRGGLWLNLSMPWEGDMDDLWPCYRNVRPGSYFPGNGFAIFNTSVFPFKKEHGFRIELLGDFSQVDGTILSIKAPQEEPMFTAVAKNVTKEVEIKFGEERIVIKSSFKRLLITFLEDLLKVLPDEDESKTSTFPVSPTSHPSYKTIWDKGRLAFGGLLGEDEGNVGSRYLTGCLDKIQVQGKDVDLDLAIKHESISSHSCPV